VVVPIAVQVLLSKNARVYIAARDESRAKKTTEELKEETGKQCVFFLKLDLADLPSVKAAVEEFTGKETKLHTLYNNGLALSQVCTSVKGLLAALQRYHIPAGGGVDQTGVRWAVRDERSRCVRVAHAPW
jgi:NAD(P)-dependent dehydrogenase (short-subunit alcohol dehydrogenase family)